MDELSRPRRYRVPILLGSLLMIGAAFLPWWRAGGDLVSGVELPSSSGIGLEGPGIVIFGAALLALVVLDIGYARGRWGFALDAPAIYLILGLAAAAPELAWPHPGHFGCGPVSVRSRNGDGVAPDVLAGRWQQQRAQDDPARDDDHQCGHQ